MPIVYHLAPAERWNAWPQNRPYLPSEYERDGFIHCTAGDDLMLRVANQYYRATPGDFVLLVIDTDTLSSPVRWEQPPDALAPEFPHIYGAIDRQAVIAVKQVRRAADGTFLGWQ